jgi:hypothetical protein
MKKVILSTFVMALLLLAIAAGAANAGLLVGPSTGQLIAADDDPNMPTMPEATLVQQRIIAVEYDPNASE